MNPVGLGFSNLTLIRVLKHYNLLSGQPPTMPTRDNDMERLIVDVDMFKIVLWDNFNLCYQYINSSNQQQ